jgi:transcriptional regulator with XRE-family HTH domain
LQTGEIIGNLSKEQGINLRQLAIKAEVPYNTLYAIVKRKSSRVDTETLIKIAKALGVQLRDLTDTSIWEEFDKQYPDMGENVARFEAVTAYLKEMGFSVDFAPEGEEGESYSAALGKDEHTAVFTQTEFEELQAGAKEAIEGRFYKKVLEQQKKK